MAPPKMGSKGRKRSRAPNGSLCDRWRESDGRIWALLGPALEKRERPLRALATCSSALAFSKRTGLANIFIDRSLPIRTFQDVQPE
jgi:hypothetical protein